MSKKKGGKLKWVVLAVVAIGVIGAVGGNSDSNTSTSSTSTKAESTKEADTPAPIEYTSVSVNDMMSQLDDNALGASDKYKGQYLEITGRLGNIDSSGKYISLYSDDEYAIIGVQCQIKNDEQRSKVASMAKGDTVTLKGKCTTVGEVLGYSVDIEEIE
nr:MAG TPA: hypothetical protein [Caudoviricetes sp.]